MKDSFLRLLSFNAIFTMALLIILCGPQIVYGQNKDKTRRQESLMSFGVEEIKLEVSTSATVFVNVTDIEADTFITASATQNNPWLADTDASSPPDVTDLTPNVLYEITFTISGGPSFDYLYFSCDPGADLSEVGFFCPNGLDAAGLSDLLLVYDGSSITERVLGIEDSEEPDMSDHFIDENWMIPYNVDKYCTDAGFDPWGQDCTIQYISYFFTPQTTVSNYSFTDVNITQPSDQAWVWDNLTVKFYSGYDLIVNGTFTAEGTTLSADTNWDGPDFKDGSEVTLTDVDILKVGAGANTGSFTIRNGADVSLLTNSDNIVLGPNFKAELGSEFLASYVSGGSSAHPGPTPELAEDIEQANRKETKASSQDISISVESYPNPFNPSTTIRYRLETDSHVVLKIYNMLGQEVKTLVSEFQSPGSWEPIWDGRNNSGSSVPSGTYIYRLEANGQTQSGQLVLVK